MRRHSILRSLLILALAVPCIAQVVRLANYSAAPFDGWKRATVDVTPPLAAGQLADGTRFVLGRRIGLDVRAIDLRVRLAPGEIRTLDLAAATPWAFSLAPLPGDPIAFFGTPSIAGAPLGVVDVRPDGAAWTVHMRARTGRMLCTDLWLAWYPDRPGWAFGEAMVDCSNPAVPDLTTAVPAEFDLRFGTCDVLVPGLQLRSAPPVGARAVGARLLPEGEQIGDGQARTFPLVLVWRQHLRNSEDWSSAGGAASLSICANGIARLWPNGNPALPAGASPLAWTINHWGDAIESLHRWAPPLMLGVAPRSNDAGEQEDQVFVGAELQAGAGGLGSETVRYLTALAQSRRPCQHLEADGELLHLASHPNLRFWDGRPHWHLGVSPDQLGKARALTELDSHGWWGPDVEHVLANTLALAARTHDSPALQRQLGALGRVYLLQWTVAPGLSTSQAYAARAGGWEGILVVHLWRGLEDRALAEQVRARWLQRLDVILLPQLGAAAGDRWDVRVDDARLGPGAWWLPWQQSVGAYGLDLAGEVFGRPAARALALRGAQRVMADAWRLEGGRWHPAPLAPVVGPATMDDSFEFFGMAMAPAVVLRNAPTDERARAVWAQLLRDGNGGGTWLAPGVR